MKPISLIIYGIAVALAGIASNGSDNLFYISIVVLFVGIIIDEWKGRN